MPQIDVFQKEPNVYITEAATQPNIPTGVGTSIGAMLGVTLWGPVGQQVLVDSLAMWESIFGSYISAGYPAQKQVKMFFKNGGKYLRFVRVVHLATSTDLSTKTSVSAFATLNGTNSTARIVVQAKYDGALGNNITVKVDVASNLVSGDIRIGVYNSGSLAEAVYDNLSLDVNSASYFKNIVNGLSNWITLIDTSNVTLVSVSLTTSMLATLTLGTNGLASLAGSDYVGDNSAGNGVKAFNGIDENLLIANVDMTSEPIALLVDKELGRWCDNDRPFNFAILATPASLKLTNSYANLATYVTATLALDSPRSALYHPWLIDEDDGEYISPVGAVMGVYSRFAADVNKGVWWSPAGTDAKLYGHAGLSTSISSSVAGQLNEKSVNLIKNVVGVGTAIWGARTLAISKARDFRYIGPRLNTSNLELVLAVGTMWAVLRPNDAMLRSQITQAVENVLYKRWTDGGLDGATKALAYRIACDDTNNTQLTKNSGIVVCQVGIRNKQTAEFIWFNVAQLSSGSFTISEGGA